MKKRELLELIRNTPPPFAEMQHALNKAFLTYGKELAAKKANNEQRKRHDRSNS